jgi:hypothetical protein
MRSVLAALAMASLAVAACASSSSRQVSPSDLLAATKQRAAKDCRPHAYFGAGLYVSRCVYSPAAFIDGEWSVMVHFVLVDKSDKYIGAMGTDAVYVFDRAGKFVKIIPGM